MKKISILILFIVAISSIAVFPMAASAQCNEITAGDRDSLRAMSGITLADGYDVEISYQNFTLYSSGVYRAFIITFDCEYWENYCYDIFGDTDCDNMLLGFEMLFSSRGYTLKKDEENAQFTASIKYESLTSMYAEMGIDGYENGERNGEETKGFLFNQYKSTTNTVFSNIETSGNLLNAVLQVCYQYGINRENILLNYTYGTPYKVIKTDADQTSYLVGQKIYTHSYNMDMDNYQRQVTLTQTTPNTSGWYVLAIAFSLLIVGVPLTFVILRKKEGKNG